MKNPLYPWSFDPLTYGHMDMAKRVCSQEDKITLAIGMNPEKEWKQMFSLQERMQLIRQAMADVMNVDVVAFRGMLTHFAYENGYKSIIRWLRNSRDYDAEKEYTMMIERQKLGIETFFLDSAKEFQDISSSAAKGILKEQWDIRTYVPLNVKQALEWRMLEQYIAWITWTIWSGKSYATEKIQKIAEKNWIAFTNLDLDKIGHYILSNSQEPEYQKTRGQIVNLFGENIQNSDTSIDRTQLGEIVFSDPEKMKTLNQLMATPLRVRLTREMYNRKWLLLYNAALTAEAQTSNVSNNNTILIDIDPQTQMERLKGRNHSEEKIQKMIASQYTSDQKARALESAIQNDKWWSLIKISSPNTDEELEQQFNLLLTKIDTFWELRFWWLLKRLGVQGDATKLFAQIRNMYDTSGNGCEWRDQISQEIKWSYHKWLHIVDSWNELYQVKHLLQNPDVVECALLFHDIVKGSEEESWQVAEKMMIERWLPREFIEKVKQLIMATKYNEDPQDEDAKYMVDIDRSILGKDPKTYTQYTKDIRREYYIHPENVFRKWRLEVLDFYYGKQIYQTPHFRERYEDQAKINISDEIQKISTEK